MIFFPLKLAWQRLSKTPTLLANVAITIGITAGILISAATLIYFTFFKPFPYENQEKIAVIENTIVDKNNAAINKGWSYNQAQYLYQQIKLKDKALVYSINDVLASVQNNPTVNSLYVTPQWFSIFKMPLFLGRLLDVKNGLNQFMPEAIISYKQWQTTFERTPDILSKSIEIRGISHKIVGVAAKGYVEPEIHRVGRQVDVWLPWDFNWSNQMKWGDWQDIDEAIQLVVKTEKSDEQQSLKSFWQNTLQERWQLESTENLRTKNWQINLKLVPLSDMVSGDVKQQLTYLLMACVGLFLIAMTNITNMLLARTAAQRRNFAICMSLGAKNKNITQDLLVEMVIIMGLAFPILITTCYVLFELLQQYFTELIPRAAELKVHGFTLIASIVLLTTIAIFLTIICKKMLNITSLQLAMKTGGKGNGSQMSAPTRRLLVISQLSVASFLVCANAYLFWTAYSEVKAAKYFNLNHAYQLQLTAKNPTKPREEIVAELRDIKQKLSQHPEISHVSVSLSPLTWSGTFPAVYQPNQRELMVSTKFVDDDYFALFGQSIILGENFSRQHVLQREAVIVVNTVFARSLASDGKVLGHTLQIFGRPHKIIGVVQGVKHPREANVTARQYLPDSGVRPNLLVKYAANQSLAVDDIRRLLANASDNFYLSSYASIAQQRNTLLLGKYTTLFLTVMLTIITIFMAMNGLYGVLSYSSEVRHVEIGTRMAVGANKKDIFTLVVGENLFAFFVSAMVSLSALLAVSYVVALNGAEIGLLITLFGLTNVVLLLLMLLACYLPLKRFLSKPAVYALRGATQ